MLKAVGVYVPNDAMSYQVSVRLKGTSPTDGSEVYTQKGTFGADGLAMYNGYRTIDLKKFVYLPNKENYIITVMLTDNNNNSIAVPYSYVDGTNVLSQPIASNSSFLFDPKTNTWVDTKNTRLESGFSDTSIPMNGLAKDSNLPNGGDFTVVSLNDYGAGGSSIYLGKTTELYKTDILHPDRKTLSNMTVELTKGLTDSWYGGVINGEGSVTKTGDGMLALSGDNTYTGSTNINAGSLALTGSLQSPVTVASGATLTGTGTINGNLTSKGTLVPGLNSEAQSLLGNTNLIGTLTVKGNLNSTGELQIAVDGTNNSKLAVSGASGIVGTKLSLIDGYNRPLANYNYTYLTSPGGITGNSTIASKTLSPYLTLTSTINGTNGILTAKETTALGGLPGMSESENSVGRSLSGYLANAIAAKSSSSTVQALNNLFYQDVAASQASIKQITNVTRAQLIAVSPLTAMTTGATYDRLNTALYDGNVNVAVPTASFDGVPATMQVSAPMTLDTTNNLWFKLLRGFESYGGTDGGFDLDNKSFGGVIGYDRAVNGTTRVGGLLSYAKTDYSTDVMSGDSHDWRIGIYASHDTGTWKTQGLISYGQNKYDFDRYIAYDNSKLSSDYTAKVFDMDLKVKYLPQYNRAKSWQVAPYVGLAYTHSTQGSYAEDGSSAFAQNIDSASNNSYRAEVGVEWKHDMTKDSSFGGSVGYKRVLSGVNPELNGTFVGDDNRFTLKTDNDRNYFTYSLNLKKNTGHNWTVQGDVRGEKSAHNHSEVYSVMAKYAF
jgi:autotransporter-associated beta strand protein